MNMLNSIILEGNVKSLPVVGEFENYNGEVSVKSSFPLTVVRELHNEKGESVFKEEYDFDIETYGEMAKFCNAHIEEGRGIRVVGRLKQKEGRVFVVAEHIEIKPARPTKA